MSNGIGHNTLNDISKVYLSQVAEQTEAEEYLETVSKVKKVENEDDKKRWAVDEAVKGQDTQDRKDAAAERRKGVGKLLPKKEGESYAKWTMAKDKWVKRKKGEIDEDKKYGYDKDGNSLNPADIEKRKRKEDDLFGSPIKKEGYSSWRTDLREIIDDSPMTDIESEKEIKEKKVKNKVKTSAMGGGIKIGEAIADLGGELLQIDEVKEPINELVSGALGSAIGGATGIGHAAGAGIAGAATGKKGRKVKKALGAGTGAAVGGALGGPVGAIIGGGVGGAIASQYEPEGEQLDELVGGAGTLVRQGVKVGGKKGGRVVQAGQKKAIEGGRVVQQKVKQGNPSKMVGSGKGEKIGAVVGGVTGGVAGGLLDGPLPVGDIVGGIAGSKVGGKIGRQFDKMGAKKEEFEVIGEVKVTKLDDKKKEDRDKKVKAMLARQAEWEKGKKKALHASHEPDGENLDEGEKTPAQKAATEKYKKIRELTNQGKHQEASKLYNAKEEWKPDPVEKRKKKAADLHRRETIASATPAKYKTDKTEDPDKLYKRRMAVDSKTKMKEEVISEKDLNAAERRALPDKDFALPGKGKGPEGKQAGSYPIPDKSHARMALAMVAKHGTPEKKEKVRAAVAKKFPGIQQEGVERPKGVDSEEEVNKATRKAAFRPFENTKPPKLKVSEDKAFDNVVAALRKKHGESGVLTKDSPKPKATSQPKRKPEKDKRSAAQREVDAQYGRTPWNKKGSLGT